MTTLDAPLCPASTRADAALRERLRAMTARSADALGDDLVAVVLGGSLARGQGMVLADPHGPRVLSDIDLYVLRRHARPDIERRLREEFVAGLLEEGLVLAPLDLAFVAPDYFAGLGDSLPARQLAIGTRVLFASETEAWVRPDVLGSPEAPVDPDDAHRLLLNRFAESHLLDGADGGWFAAVHRAKRWIDAPLAWLAAHGHHHPSRAEQLRRLEDLGRAWDGAPRAWLDDGIEVARRWLDAIATREIDPDELRAWPDRGPDAVLHWTWPFARALFEDAGRADADPVTTLRRAAAAPRFDPSLDVPVVERWLRRDPLPARWRRARRWHPLAPVAIRPWWRYASGGTGPDRVYAASSLLYAGHDAWKDPLDSVLRDAPRTLVDGAPAVGRLWADWILGGGRR